MTGWRVGRSTRRLTSIHTSCLFPSTDIHCNRGISTVSAFDANAKNKTKKHATTRAQGVLLQLINGECNIRAIGAPHTDILTKLLHLVHRPLQRQEVEGFSVA